MPDDVPGASPDLLDGLNDAQRLAVLATEGPTLIVAGAGSGKTRVLTHRIAHLIKDKRVPPTAVLAITFTNKAAREMQERLRHLVGPVVKAMWVSTFHSACVRILRRSGSHLGYTSTFSIYDEGDAERLMTQVCRQLDYDPKRLSARSMRNAVSAWKDQLVDPEAAADRALGWFEKKAAEAYRLYQRRLAESNAMDFDDLILQTVRLFQEHPDVLASYQQRFRYVLVDEFQDTNVAQYELLKLLAAEHRNLSVVGDGDQSIYAFRGATVRNILDFEADYPEANVILLEQNYRSTQTILSAANAVIANNLERKPKNLWTAIGSGNPIVRYQAENEHDEAAYVVEEVERLHDQGLGYGKVVVFYRTNAQSRALEEVFVKAGLPYKIVGGVKFYDRREVKDLLAYLKATVNPLDTVSLRRVLNVPRRGIGDTSERAIDRFATEEGIPFGEALRRAGEVPGLGARQGRAVGDFVAVLDELAAGVEEGRSPSVLVQDAWTLSGLMRELEADTSIEGQGRVENVRELQSAAEEYELREGQEAEPTLPGFLESIALVTDADQVEAGSQSVTLMTLHTAKGLEYPVVFIVGLGGERVPPRPLHRRAARAGGGAAPGLCRHHPGPGAAVPDQRLEPDAVRIDQLQPAVALPQGGARGAGHGRPRPAQGRRLPARPGRLGRLQPGVRGRAEQLQRPAVAAGVVRPPADPGRAAGRPPARRPRPGPRPRRRGRPPPVGPGGRGQRVRAGRAGHGRGRLPRAGPQAPAAPLRPPHPALTVVRTPC